MREDFKAAMRYWQAGLCLVTAVDADGAPIGLVCNSFASLSMEPPLLSWAVDHGSTSIVGWRSITSYALHIFPPLARPLDHPLARVFAQKGGDKFADLTFERNALGDPVFPLLPTRFDCLLHQRVTVGDHDLMIGRPTLILHPDNHHPSTNGQS